MNGIRFVSPPMPHYIVGGEDTYRPGGYHPARTNIGVFDLLVVTRGCLCIAEEEERYAVSPGRYLLLRPDRAHRSYQACDAETHFYWLHLHTEGAWQTSDELEADTQRPADDPYVRLHQFAFVLPQYGTVVRTEALHDLLRQLTLWEAEPYSAARLKQQASFQQVLLLLTEDTADRHPAPPSFAVAERAAAYLQQRYREPISYEAMAEALHFHPNYVARCMKRVYGCTPLEYLIRYRLEQAKHRLAYTDEPIGEIAADAGFGSFAYFVKRFVKQVGCRPRDYRLRYRSRERR